MLLKLWTFRQESSISQKTTEQDTLGIDALVSRSTLYAWRGRLLTAVEQLACPGTIRSSDVEAIESETLPAPEKPRLLRHLDSSCPLVGGAKTSVLAVKPATNKSRRQTRKASRPWWSMAAVMQEKTVRVAGTGGLFAD